MATTTRTIVRLGSTPKFFKPIVVEFDMPDGTLGAISVTYIYRTRTGYGQFVDDMTNRAMQTPAPQATSAPAATPAAESAAAPAPAEADEGLAAQAAPSTPAAALSYMSEGMALATRQGAEFILGCIGHWDLDVPLDAVRVQQLIDELPAAGRALTDGYRRACVEGHLGN